jgi:D-sedoheptulose 7-phosphate isomerase
MGNGGSASTASHWVCDILKGCSYGLTSKPFKILSLNDNLPTLLAYANDVGYEDVFVEQLKNFCKNDDLLIAISGSGNSKNVIKAIEYGRTVGAYTVALTGYSGGKLKELAHLSLHINVNDMQVAEDCHSIIMHSTMQSLLYGTT